MAPSEVWNESLRCRRRGEVREKRRRTIPAIVAVFAEVIGRMVEI